MDSGIGGHPVGQETFPAVPATTARMAREWKTVRKAVGVGETAGGQVVVEVLGPKNAKRLCGTGWPGKSVWFALPVKHAPN